MDVDTSSQMSFPLSKFTTFLAKSDTKHKTFSEDENLPRLPLPEITHTLNRYLDSVRPFVSHEDFSNTYEIVKRFEQGPGLLLQAKLKKKAGTEKNWLEKWWENFAYLEDRKPLLQSSSMNAVMPKNILPWTYGSEQDQIKHASLFGYHLVKFWNALRREDLLPTQTSDKQTFFSMYQYKKLFNTVRIPGEEKDFLMCYFKTMTEGNCPNTVIIICSGRIFCFNVQSSNKNFLTLQEWEGKIKAILRICSKPNGKSQSMGLLTCDSRQNWFKNRKYLQEISERNRETLGIIEKSLFVLVLDDSAPDIDSEVLNTNIGGNYKNRWADKSMNIIIYKNGRIGTLSDHTAFDGIVALSCLSFVVASIDEGKKDNTKPNRKNNQNVTTEEMLFDLDDKIIEEVNRLEIETSVCKNDVLMGQYLFTDFGKNEIQRMQYHSDTFIQMCLQLAYVALHGKPGPCYETATTRKFYRGRTETLRACTIECLEWVATMLDNKTPNDEKKILLERAFTKHEKLMSEARENKGCDRHLLGLYYAALEEKMKIPDFFLDPSYNKSGGNGNFVLSTSCTGYSVLGGGVPPMCDNGYGIFYNILPTSINFIMSVKEKNEETNMGKYYECLKESLRKTREVVLNSKFSKL